MRGALGRDRELEVGLVGLDEAGVIGGLVVVHDGQQQFQLHRGGIPGFCHAIRNK